MLARKIATLALMVLVAAMVSQPAMAGVGGCRFPGVGGCTSGGGLISTTVPDTRTPSILDSLDGILPAQVVAFLKGIFDKKDGVVDRPGDLATEGVGGCFRPGVGGCAPL